MIYGEFGVGIVCYCIIFLFCSYYFGLIIGVGFGMGVYLVIGVRLLGLSFTRWVGCLVTNYLIGGFGLGCSVVDLFVDYM